MNAVPSGVCGVVERDAAFARGRLTLRGVLACTASQASGAAPAREAVVTLHGWGGTRTGPHRLFVTLGRAFAAGGLPALRFDHAGRGESDGDAHAADLDGMIADVFAAQDFLRDRLGVERVHLVGLCSGGNVALGAATLAPQTTGRLVCVSTLPFTGQTAARGRRKAWGYLKEYLRKAADPDTWRRLRRGEASIGGAGRVLAGSLSESKTERSLKDSARDIPAGLGAVRHPVLFIHGGGDPEAPDARAAYEALARTHRLDAAFATIPDANHNFYSLLWSAALRARIRDAFADILSAPGMPERPGAPGAPDTSDTSDTSDTPDTPDTPDASGLSDSISEDTDNPPR